MGRKIKKSDKIEQEIREQTLTKEPSLVDIWVEVCVNKALTKHIIDNDINHLWRAIFILTAGVLGLALGIIVDFILGRL